MRSAAGQESVPRETTIPTANKSSKGKTSNSEKRRRGKTELIIKYKRLKRKYKRTECSRVRVRADRNCFLSHSNLNNAVLSAGKFWALCCPDSLASHQRASTLRGLFRLASSDVVIKKPPLTNSLTSTGFLGSKSINSIIKNKNL